MAEEGAESVTGDEVRAEPGEGTRPDAPAPYVPDLIHGGVVDSLLPPRAVGDRIAGRFEVRQVFYGGMAWVFAVYDHAYHVPRALKTFKWESESDLRRRARLYDAFTREIGVWTGLGSHPNIVRARWAKKLEGLLFLALEYVPPPPGKHGQKPKTLREYLTGTPLPLDQVMRWALGLCEGMRHAHSHGLDCHRDLTPRNVMITHDLQVKITDFGLAVATSAATQSQPVLASAALPVEDKGRKDDRRVATRRIIPGTDGYRSPEQYRGDAPLDVRSDVYNLGLMLHQMLTGSALPPFSDRPMPDPEEVYLRQMSEAPPRLDIPLWPIIEKCLARDREERYASFSEVRDEIARQYRDLTGVPFRAPAARPSASWEKVNQAVSFVSLGMFDEAVRLSDEVLAREPTSVAALNTRGAAYAAKGQYDLAAPDYERAIALSPNDPRILCNRAALLLDRGEAVTAVRDYGRALESEPKMAAAYAGRARAYADLDRPELALADYDRAILLQPRDACYFFERGSLHAETGDIERALKDFDQAIAMDPVHADAYCNRGLAHLQRGHLREAIADLEKAVALQPRDAVLWGNLGNALAADGQFARAVGCYSEALRLDPADPAFWNNRGNALAERGDTKRAIDDYQQALRLKPDFADAWLNKARAEEELGLHLQSLTSYRGFLRIASAAADPRVPLIHQRIEKLTTEGGRS